MQLSFTEKKNVRKNFGKLREALSIPNLIEVQKNSYKELTELKDDIDGVLSRANELGVTKFICVGTDITDSIKSYKLDKMEGGK